MALSFSLNRINWILGTLVVGLALAGLASELAIELFDDDWGFGLVPLVNLEFEGNLPTWYSSTLLFGCAALLAVIAWVRLAGRAPYRRHWALLAAIFLYLSIDESAVIHEMINPIPAEAFAPGGGFPFPWVLPFGALVVAFAVGYLGFLGHLPARFRTRFVAAGAIYVGGALGTELPIGFWYAAHGGDNLAYGLMNVAQESLEILGATIFCSALLAYIQAELGEIRVTLTRSNP